MHHTISPLSAIICTFTATIDNSSITEVFSGSVFINQVYSIIETHDYSEKQGTIKLMKVSSFFTMGENTFDISGQISPIVKNNNLKLIFGRGLVGKYSFLG